MRFGLSGVIAVDKRKKVSQTTEKSYVDTYREKIAEMVEQIADTKFLAQIHTILKKHMEKRGN